MTTPPPIRLFLADRHPVILDALQGFCAQHPPFTLTASAHTVDEVRERIPAATFDVLLVDVLYLGGPPFLRELMQRVPDCRVLVYTDLQGFVPDLFTAGAQGYVCKKEPTGELVAGLLTVARGEPYRSPIAEECWAHYQQYGPHYLAPRQAQAIRAEHGGSGRREAGLGTTGRRRLKWRR